LDFRVEYYGNPISVVYRIFDIYVHEMTQIHDLCTVSDRGEIL